MQGFTHRHIILMLSVLLVVLITISSAKGLFTSHFYAAETPNWQTQSKAQDLMDLFLVVPCLIFSLLFYIRGYQKALLFWNGILLYLVYTFVLFCFDVHFNRLFILYCLILGLSFYALLYNLLIQQKEIERRAYPTGKLQHVTALYFIFIALVFYLLWLAEIVPSLIRGVTPPSVLEAGLFTNGVQVLDLSVILPAIFISGVLLWKKHPLSQLLVPMFLTFFVLMDLTIAGLIVMMKINGLGAALPVAVVMCILAFISLLLLYLYEGSTKNRENS